MKMTILNIAYPFSLVSADSVGGAEQVLVSIDEALVEAGHQSIVVAAQGSRVRGTLLESCALGRPLTSETRLEQHRLHRATIQEALRRFDVDLIHLHGVDFYEYLPETSLPVLATLHLPPDWYPDSVWTLDAPNLWLHCVSLAQHERCPHRANLLAPIQNGVRVPPATSSARRGNYALTLGRICPEKGFHLAMDAAKLTGLPLGLGGEVFPYETHLRYFENEIRPREDRRRRFLGPLNALQKYRFLKRARCLLIPSLVPETSSLAAMEAMACGTPVIAFRLGALPSLIEHGRTGFLVDSVPEMAQAILNADQIDPNVCHSRAKEFFSRERMTDQYLKRYAGIIAFQSNRRRTGPLEPVGAG